MSIRVIIGYTNKLNSITVDGIEMEDISGIQNKEIEKWFEPSRGRDGWEGLIKEVNKSLGSDRNDISFEFYGPPEYKDRFEKELAKNGFEGTNSIQNREVIIKNNMDIANKALNRGMEKKAMDSYKNLVSMTDDAEAKYKIAEIYLSKLDPWKDLSNEDEDIINSAIDYLEESAEQKYFPAIKRLYEMYRKGYYVETNTDKTEYWLIKGSEVDPSFMGLLGCHYYQANNKEKAVECFMKGADAGDPLSLGRLGARYHFGDVVEQDNEKAFQLLNEAYNKGYYRACQILSLIYMGLCEDCLIHKDVSKAKYILEEAAEHDCSMAYWWLGKYYKYGNESLGIEKEPAKSIEYFEKILEIKKKYETILVDEFTEIITECHNIVEYQLADIYLNYDGYSNVERGKELLEKSVELGSTDGILALANEYYLGTHWTRDYCQAAILFEKALNEYGIEENQWIAYCLGFIYYDGGYGIEHNYEKARDHFKIGVEHGDSTCIYQLGFMYINRMFGNNDDEFKKGIELWKKCAENSDDFSEELRGEISYDLGKIFESGYSGSGLGKYAALTVAGALIPGANLITIPAMLFGGLVSDSVKQSDFAKSEVGIEMFKYFKLSADLGNEDGIKKYDEWKSWFNQKG